MSVNTPNMNLQLPTVNVDNGLTWEMDVNNNTIILDSHNHTSGNGVQIPPSGLNINSDLSFQSNSAIGLKSLILTDQVSDAVFNSIYSVAGELYWNDGASNVVKITSGGTVNATSSGISSGTATASFVGPLLVVNSAPNTPADIQIGSVFLGNNIASSNFLKLSPPSAMAASYTITLPALPASAKVISLDASGTIATGIAGTVNTVDLASNSVSTIKIVDASITSPKLAASAVQNAQLAANAVQTVNIADANVTKPKLAALGQQVSSAVSFTTSSTSYVTVTGLTATITSTGRPVWVGITHSSATTSASLLEAFDNTGTGNILVQVQILRNGSSLAVYALSLVASPSSSVTTTIIPTSALNSIDVTAPAGSNVYTVKMLVSNTTAIGSISNARLVVYEL